MRIAPVLNNTSQRLARQLQLFNLQHYYNYVQTIRRDGKTVMQSSDVKHVQTVEAKAKAKAKMLASSHETQLTYRRSSLRIVLTICVKIKPDDSFLFAYRSAKDKTHKHKHISIIRIIVATTHIPDAEDMIVNVNNHRPHPRYLCHALFKKYLFKSHVTPRRIKFSIFRQ